MVAQASAAAYAASVPWFWNWTWLQGCTDNLQRQRHIRANPRTLDGQNFVRVYKRSPKSRTLCGREIQFGFKGKLSELQPCKRCAAAADKLKDAEHEMMIAQPDRTPGEVRKWMKNRVAKRAANPWKKGTTRSGRLGNRWAKKTTNKKLRQQHLRLV